MEQENHDQNLLFGLLGLYTGLISREDLLAAVGAWLETKSHPLAEILLAKKAVSPDEYQLLSALVEKHLVKRPSGTEGSLPTLSRLDAVVGELRQIADPRLEAALSAVSSDAGTSQQHDTLETSAGKTHVPLREMVGSASERYRVLRPHARGGLGEVFVALDRELNRDVALKEIQRRHANDSDSRSRFVLEAEITGHLEHPGIVPVYGLGQYPDGRPFYAMRFVRGETLRDAANRFHRRTAEDDPRDDAPSSTAAEAEPHQPFDSVEFRKLLGRFIDVCNAIGYAHSRGILHRDLKPGNIMLGKYGETLVVDWGLAKPRGRSPGVRQHSDEYTLRPTLSSGSAATQVGTAIGTPAYMPPEQAEGNLDELGPASDVYSLGATLFYLLTGQAPVRGRSIDEVLQSVREGDITEPRAIDPQIPKPLEAICLRAMAHRPQDRYATPQELAEDIERYLADEPVGAHAEPAMVRLRRWLRKHPRSVAAAATTMLAGLVGSVLIAVIVSGKNQELADRNQKLDESYAALERSRADADEKRRRAERVMKYLTEAFGSVDPHDEGYDVTVAEVLDAAFEQAGQDFQDDALGLAQLSTAIGHAYYGLGKYDSAIPAHEQALEIYQRKLGPFALTTLQTMNALAMALESDGRWERCLPMFEQTLRLFQEHVGEDDPQTWTIRNNLAVTYQSAGKLDKAAALLEDVVSRRKQLSGNAHRETLTAIANLAAVYHSLQQQEKSVPLLEDALALAEAEYPPLDPLTLGLKNNLAMVYQDAGRPEEAFQVLQELLELFKQAFSEQHPHTLIMMNNLALAYHGHGHHDKSLPLFEKALEIKRDTLGEDHPSTLNAKSNLATVYDDAGRYAAADELHFAVLEQRRAAENDPKLVDTLVMYSRNQLLQEKYVAAEELSRESLAVLEEQRPDHWLTYHVKSQLGGALAGQQQFADAEPLLLEGWEGMQERENEIPFVLKPRLQEAGQRIVRLYEHWDQPDKAAAWRQKLEAGEGQRQQ